MSQYITEFEGKYLLNSSECAKLLNCSRTFFYRLVKAGKIAKVPTGQRKNYQYKKQTILDYINGAKTDN